MKYTKCLPFYANQIINPFLNSRFSKNHDKVDGLSVNPCVFFSTVESLLTVYFLEFIIKIGRDLMARKMFYRKTIIICQIFSRIVIFKKRFYTRETLRSIGISWWSSRKALLLITIYANSFSFSSFLFF